MTVTDAFAPLAASFAALAEDDPTYSGRLAVYHRGRLALDLTVGDGLTQDALIPVFSSSKGAIGVVVGRLVQAGLLDLDAAVSRYWPEFAAAGKADIAVRTLLSHQAGLNGVDGGFTDEDLLAHTPLAEKLAAQRPLWAPGEGFCYHAYTIGTLADELVRRITGRTLAEVFGEDVAAPRGIDVHLGVPASLDHRVVTVDSPPEEVLAAYFASRPSPAVEGLAARSAPTGGASLLTRVNDEDYRRAGSPAVGGLATAEGLARLYASLAHDLGGPRVLSEQTISQVTRTQVCGEDLGSCAPLRFAVVFQNPLAPRMPFGSDRAFGHDGAGGSMAYLDPEHDLAVGYVAKRVHVPADLSLGPDPRMELTALARTCAAAA